jgi:hypothetical protein
MSNLIKEEQYVFQMGKQEHTLVVQEQIWGVKWWPEKCRVQVASPETNQTMKFYGATPREVVERAVEYLTSFASATVLTGMAYHLSDRLN